MKIAEAESLPWGTYGKGGKDPLRWVTLGECSIEHLCNILITQHQITPEYREACRMIVNERLVSIYA
jgi:hypothetical protein